MLKKIKFQKLIISFIILINFMFIAYSNNNTSYASENNNLSHLSITVNNDTRTFYVYTPPNYNMKSQTNELLPLVLVFHGSTADGTKIMNYTKFNLSAEKNNAIAVYPEKKGIEDWELKTGEKSSDIKFISELINYMIKNYKVDKTRVYSVGYSSGADLSLLLASSIPNKIAAFAAVSGNMRKHFIPDCQTTQPISLLMINGTQDPYDKWNGNGNDMLSVEDSLKFWKDHNKCTAVAKETIFPHKESQEPPTKAKLYITEDPENKSEISLLKIEGGGHTWPGSPTNLKTQTFLGKTNYDISGNDIIWDFFNRHKLN